MQDTSDWPTAKRNFQTMFRNRLGKRQPNHPKGANFVTSDFLGFVKVEGTTVEVTTGWMMASRLYGLTWPRLDDGSPNPLDRPASSLNEVADALGIDTVRLLDCGHFPTPMHGWTVDCGYSYGADNETRCYACSDDQTKQEIANLETDRISLYVSSSAPDMAYVTTLANWTVTTWNGTKMGRVVESSSECVNYTPSGGRYSFYSITVKMDDGSLWFGRASGPGMLVNLKRKKGPEK